MTGAQLNTLINFKCGTNDTTFPQATKLPLVNMFIDELASLIVEKNSGYLVIPAKFNLVADQREYSFDDTLLNRIHKVEIKFSSSSSRFPATFIKDYGGSETESEIVKRFANNEGEFAYTIRRRGILLLSGTISNVTDGGRIWYHKYPASLADLTGSTDLSIDPSTTTFGFPRQFHELLARRVAIEYKGSRAKPIPLNDKEKTFENDLARQLNAISSIDNSAEYIGEMPAAQDIGNNGFSY